MSKQIIVTVEGGVVQNIVGIPDDVKVVVRDFDVEGADLSQYLEDKELRKVRGDLCVESTWGPSLDQDEGSVPATREDIE